MEVKEKVESQPTYGSIMLQSPVGLASILSTMLNVTALVKSFAGHPHAIIWVMAGIFTICVMLVCWSIERAGK